MQPTLNEISVHPSQGLNETLKQLPLLENKALSNQSFVTWVFKNLGTDCVPCVPGKVWKFIRKNFEFVKDGPHDEVIIAPYLMLDIKQGDCDDFSLFAKTCLDILGGWYTFYLLLGKDRFNFSHILVYANRGQGSQGVIDPVYIDGANKVFNVIPDKYNYYKIV